MGKPAFRAFSHERAVMRNRFLLSPADLPALHAARHATDPPDQAGAGMSFHYIIVGAGSAGCVLANRLSANPATRVCLVEAGPPDRNPMIHMPFGLAASGPHALAELGLCRPNRNPH
jgi:hypothetical protein